VNRKQRRTIARQTVAGQHLRGAKKQEAVRGLTQALRNSPAPAEDEAQAYQDKHGTRVARRKSGLYEVRRRWKM